MAEIIKLTDAGAAQAAETARTAAQRPEAAARIFEHSDQAKTQELKPAIVAALSKIYDPEIPVNIHDLGLIYDVAVDGDGNVGVRMTLTAPACPAAQTLPVEVVNRLKALPGVTDARVDIVWDPPWDRDRMSDAAKLQLGMF
jgi:FeS assembly SUF system protein